jgi:hypothetical protein
MRIKLVSSVLAALATFGFLSVGAVIPSAAADTAPTSTDSAFLNALPVDAEPFGGSTFHFDGGSPTFDVDSYGRADFATVTLEDSHNAIDIDITAPAGASTLVPGHYDDENPASVPPLGFDLSVNRSGCRGHTVGDITDIARGTNNTITRFAMTFSHSCGSIETVIGEVRFHEPATSTGSLSTSPTTVTYGRQTVGVPRDVPVQVRNSGASPVAITSSTTGPFRVVSSTCGTVLAAAGTCEVLTRFDPVAGGAVSGALQLHGSDGSSTTVPLSGTGRAGFTGLTMQSSTGDYIGGGRDYRYTESNGSELEYFTVTPSYVRFRASGPDAATTGDVWDLFVAPPAGRTFRVGDTFPVQRESFQTAPYGGLDIGGQGRGCNTVSGTVRVADFETSPDGRVLRFDLQMVQNCDGSGPPLVAALGYAAPTVTIAGASTQASPYGATVSVTGTADPGAHVGVWFRSAHESAFVQRRTLVAGSNGVWSTSYTATDDYRLYATNGSAQSAVLLEQIAPTVNGPTSRTVRRNSTVAISGTATPGATVTLHFHKAGTAASDYSILRTVSVGSRGSWSRSYLASTDYRYFASLPNGQVSPTVLAQAR